MQAEQVERVVEQLRARGVMAHVAHAGAFTTGVRVVLPGGREAVWDTDGAAGLEAQVLMDGVLVGFVPQIPGSDSFSEAQVVDAIAREDYSSR